MNYANLHLHSFFSDGVFTPQQLCALAKQKGYGAVAVSDHETARGVEFMRLAAKELGLEFISAMETYAFDFGTQFHILAHDFEPNKPHLHAYTTAMEEAAATLTKARFDACKKSGIIREICWQQVLDRFPHTGWLCNEQVFDTMKAFGEATEADYWKFFSQFQQAATAQSPKIIDSKTMISLIRGAGGVAVLAHPHRQTQHLAGLLKNGLGGVEASHPDIDEADEQAARAFAHHHHLYTTGGTDHTGLLGTLPSRGDDPMRLSSLGNGALMDYTADVSHGASKEEFDALRSRIYG